MIASIWLLPAVLLLAAFAAYGGQAFAEPYQAPDSGTVHTVTPADFGLLDDNGLPHSCAAVICPGYEREDTSDPQFIKYEISTSTVADGDTVVFADGAYDLHGPIVIRHTNLTVSSDDGDGVTIRSTDNKGLIFRNHGDVPGLAIRGLDMESADTTRLAPARNFGMIFIEDTAGHDGVRILDNTFRGDKQNGVRIGSSDRSSLFTNVEIRNNTFETIPADRNPVHLSNAEVTLFANTFERSDYVHLDGDGSLADLYSLYPGKPDRAPSVTAPPSVELEATGPLTAVTPERLGIATALDDRDQFPVISNDSPGSFAIGNHTVTWTATDSAGNSRTAGQLVTIRDTTPPDAALIGDLRVMVELGGTYEEMYATCTDLVDGDLPMTMNDVVDTSTPGEYVVEYSCTDTAGNPASVTRTVTVVAAHSTQPTDLDLDAWHFRHGVHMGGGLVMMSASWTEPGQPPEAGYNITVSRPDGTLRQLSQFDILVAPADSGPVLSYSMDGSMNPQGGFEPIHAALGIAIHDDIIYMMSPDHDLHAYNPDGTYMVNSDRMNGLKSDTLTGLASHGGKLWQVLDTDPLRHDTGASQIISYNLLSTPHVPGKAFFVDREFDTHANITQPTGIAALDDIVYVADGHKNRVFAFGVNGTYLSDESFDLDPATSYANGMTAEEATDTLWVLDDGADKVYAYSSDADNGIRRAMFSFDLESGSYGGIAITPAVTSDTITVPPGTNSTAYYYRTITEYFTHTVQSASSSTDPPATLKTRNHGIASLAAPTDFTITSYDHNSVSVSWMLPSDDSGIILYQLFADRGTKFPPRPIDRDANFRVDPSVTSHTLTGLLPDTEYITTIRSYNTYDKQRALGDSTHRESIPVSHIFTTEPPSRTIFNDVFDVDLGRWTYLEQPYGHLNSMFCGEDAATNTYILAHSAENGGSAHVGRANGTEQCWFGSAGLARTFDVPAVYGGDDLIVTLDYRSQAGLATSLIEIICVILFDVCSGGQEGLGAQGAAGGQAGTTAQSDAASRAGQILGRHTNNLFYAVTDSAGNDLVNGQLFPGGQNGTAVGTSWNTAAITVSSLDAASCPCEMVVHTTDLDWDVFNKRFHIDNVNATMMQP